MAATTFHKTKDSTVTIGSTQEQSRLMSDVVIGGAEKTQVSKDAIDGTNYAYAGNAGPATIEFDFLQGPNYNISEMVYGPETTSGSPVTHSLNWGGSGTAKTITVANVRSADSQTLTVTMTSVDGISTPITLIKGEDIMRRFTGTVSANSVDETILEGT